MSTDHHATSGRILPASSNTPAELAAAARTVTAHAKKRGIPEDDVRIVLAALGLAPAPARPKRGRKRKPIEHGSPSGAQAHRRRGEEPCRACLDAANADVRAWRAANPDKAAQHLARRRDKYANNPAEQEKARAYHRARVERLAAAGPPTSHGTRWNAQQHRFAGEPPCEICRDGERAYNLRRRDRRAADQEQT